MANKRVSLKDRRAKDRRGVDALFGDDGSPVAPPEEKPRLAKVTMYVRPEQVEAVEEIQFSERKRTGQKPDKSDLFQEALDLLIARYGLRR